MVARQRARYQERIVVDPAVLVGKPIIKGTRISVELVLRRLAKDFDPEAILRAFPHLTRDDIRACVECAAARQY